MRLHKVMITIGLSVMAAAANAAPPSFQALMDPAVFPEPQRGMVVEDARLDRGQLQVTTTGASFEADLRRGMITGSQRIGHSRPLLRLRLGKSLAAGKLTHQTRGMAIAAFDQPRVTLRVNGDSLLMLHAHEPLTVSVESLIQPAWNASHHANHLLADEWGGFGLYCSAMELDDHFEPYNANIARYRLPADAVLWVAVCPPKPYDWERSLRDNVIWHWSDKLAYPSDETLHSWKPYGNTVLLQAEVMLWKDWNLDFVPRLGPEEFARVRKTLHDQNMRFIVYTSPYYFLKGTELEGQALNSFKDFKGWPPGTGTGENIELFMPAITRVMRNYQPDGLYFDGQYMENPAALYALARRTRALLGEEGILEWHSTYALGSHECFLPTADAYVDFVLRGEGTQDRYADFDYLRYFVSGYNLHNSIGVLCNNGSVTVTPELARNVLRSNARFHTLVSWLDDAPVMETLRKEYQAHLTPALREQVEQGVNERQTKVAKRWREMQAELAELKRPPVWKQPLFTQTFAALPAAKQVVSPQNTAPFRVADGALKIRGHAHTYAFLSLPLSGKVGGMVVRLRQGSDGGMAWGPAALLRFANGSIARIGTRADDTLQADLPDGQHYGSSYRKNEWIWLRVRWLAHWGVVERSADGKRFTPVWTFQHNGLLNDTVKELLIGKVSYSGAAQDHSEPGTVGESQIESVRVYAAPER